eukprot:COSAG01_NODE_15556_length_1324_cov_1.168163_1_plen_69_part_10
MPELQEGMLISLQTSSFSNTSINRRVGIVEKVSEEKGANVYKWDDGTDMQQKDGLAPSTSSLRVVEKPN